MFNLLVAIIIVFFLTFIILKVVGLKSLVSFIIALIVIVYPVYLLIDGFIFEKETISVQYELESLKDSKMYNPDELQSSNEFVYVDNYNKGQNKNYIFMIDGQDKSIWENFIDVKKTTDNSYVIVETTDYKSKLMKVLSFEDEHYKMFINEKEYNVIQKKLNEYK